MRTEGGAVMSCVLAFSGCVAYSKLCDGIALAFKWYGKRYTLYSKHIRMDDQ